ncbi:hypothetical protein [Hymenobacter rubidus]|uniref:hypothetical protein n=1 Tax=Hymenobacter rubidus TaxID=1441626 RepID=UPI00191F641E|nr:hypothetical protein [Hymenobacter rubidus]
MHKFLVLLATAAATSTTCLAQAPVVLGQTGPAPTSVPKPSDQMVERRTQYLAKELGLSADQQAKLKPILLAQRQDMQTLHQQVSTAGRRRGLGQDVKANQAKYDEQIRAVLTPAQYTKFDQLRTEQREKLRDFRATGQAGQAAQPTE